MNNKGMKNSGLMQTIALLLLFTLLLVPFSGAEELVEIRNGPAVVSAFYASMGATNYDVCAYESFTDSITLRNQGSLYDTYYITIADSGTGITEWVTSSDSVMTLKAGEEKTLYLYTKTGADITGDYSYTVTITSTYDADKVIEKTVHVSECANLALSAPYSGQETCPCSTGVYVFELVNSGAFTEDYSLWLEGVESDSYKLSEYYVTLGAGERMTIYGYVRFPCDIYGTFDLSMMAVSKNTQYEAVLPLFLEVEQACYAFSVALGEPLIFTEDETLDLTFKESFDLTYEFCEEDAAVIPVYMENPSHITNEYHVYVEDAESWISATQPYIRLKGMQSYVSSLIVNTGAAEPGLYSFAVKVESTRGNLQSVIPFTVEVIDCDGSGSPIPQWLEILLWVLLGLLIVGIIVLAAFLFIRSRDGKGTKKTSSKKTAKKTAAGTWFSKHKWWFIPLLLLLLLLLLVGALGWPMVQEKIADLTDGAAEGEEARTLPTLLYNWVTALLLLLLLLLLALLLWWFKLCDKARRRQIIDKIKKKWKGFWAALASWFSRLWKKIKPWLKWLWIILLILLLLSGLVAGLYFLYNNYKDDAGRLFADDTDDEISITDDELQTLIDKKQALLNDVADEAEGDGVEIDDALDTEQDKLDTAQETLDSFTNTTSNDEREKLKEEIEAIGVTLLDELEKAIDDELLALQEDLLALQEKIEEKQEQIKALEAELLEKIEEAVEGDLSAEELDALQDELDALQDEINTLEEELDALYEERQALLDQIDNLAAKIQALEDHVAQLEGQIDTLDDQIAALQALVAQLTANSLEDDQLVADIEEELDALEKEKNTLEEEKDILEGVIQDVISTVTLADIPEISDDDFKTVLVFDVSLSGQIIENGTSRFDRGIQEAQKYIQDQGVYTIMITGKNGLIIRRNADPEIAIRVLKTLRPLDTQSNLGRALYAAASDFRTRQGIIVLVSDMITTDGTDLNLIRKEIEEQGIDVIFLNVALESTTITQEETEEETIDTEEEVEMDDRDETGDEEPEDVEESKETVDTTPIFDVESQTKGSFFIEIPMNTPLAIDLNSYFADPDGDDLIYSAEVGEHVNAVLDGSSVTLIPETDWTGDTSVRFGADDGKGGIVQSPDIRVSVIPTGEVPSYIPWIIIGSIIGLIIISLVFGAFSKKFDDIPENEG
jgi:hypothetical protein